MLSVLNLTHFLIGSPLWWQVDVREALIRACVHLVNREWEPLAEDFVDLQLLPRGQETSQVRRMRPVWLYCFRSILQEALRRRP